MKEEMSIVLKAWKIGVDVVDGGAGAWRQVSAMENGVWDRAREEGNG